MRQNERYLELLSTQYENRYAVYTKLINLTAVLNMPKGTEHFISDIHGEYEAFKHILNNSSGVIKEKVNAIFPDLSQKSRDDLCTLIYYPDEVLEIKEKEGLTSKRFYKENLLNLVKIANFLSSKYARSKVRKLIDVDFTFIVDELMHAKSDENKSRVKYHESILDSIIKIGSAKDYVKELSKLVKRLSVERLHVLGDIFDRGLHPDKCFDLLMKYHKLDLQWGNHDVLWMGACCGSELCGISVLCNNLRYHNYKMLENGYGISLRRLAIFANQTYKGYKDGAGAQRAVSIIYLKLLGQLVKRHPEYHMESRLVLDNIDLDKGTVPLNGIEYELNSRDFPTLDKNDPYSLSLDEKEVVDDLVSSFKGSVRLKKHVEFLYSKGSMYKCCNGNLLYHGCIPMEENGEFSKIDCDGVLLSGRAYLDYCETRIREGYTLRTQDNLDFFWYMWSGPKSPLYGRQSKTFERCFVKGLEEMAEPRDPYYSHYYNEKTCNRILENFNLEAKSGHIINGHTPIMAKDGESPVRANGKLLVIDGGFCRAYQAKTGIAGYTLIYSSHYLHLKAHAPFTTIDDAIRKNSDIADVQIIKVEDFKKRKMVVDTDKGKDIKYQIKALNSLLNLYNKGILPEKMSNNKDDLQDTF